MAAMITICVAREAPGEGGNVKLKMQADIKEGSVVLAAVNEKLGWHQGNTRLMKWENGKKWVPLTGLDEKDAKYLPLQDKDKIKAIKVKDLHYNVMSCSTHYTSCSMHYMSCSIHYMSCIMHYMSCIIHYKSK